jgi:hypothetical protein
MPKSNRLARGAFIMSLSMVIAGFPMSFPKDATLKPEELVAEHVKSIGNPDVLAQIQSRVFAGTTTVQFLQGGTGQLNGQCQFASEGRKLGIVMQYNALEYPGEHFAFDGKDVTIGRPTPGRTPPLADFINQYGGLIKEGLLSGTLSVSWPLLKLKEMQPRLKYGKSKIGGRAVHTLGYNPKKGLGDFKIVLFFDPDTFHHVKTEYKLRIAAAMGTGSATTQKEVSDSIYLLSEDFDDFREVEGMTLPHIYTISLSAEGPRRTFLAHWILEAKQWVHNGQIDSKVFNVDK